MALTDRRRMMRAFLIAVATIAALTPVGCGGGGGGVASAPTEVASPTPQPPATPPCNGEQRLTPATAEGAAFRPGSPQRASLIEPALPGEPIVIIGAVLSINCQPIPAAVLDFWQADAFGAYDLTGSRLRGHQIAGSDGRYLLQTIVPAAQAGHAPTIHVKVQAPSGETLTTQLFFAGDTLNSVDPAFADALAMDVQVENGEKVGGFDFVLNVK